MRATRRQNFLAILIIAGILATLGLLLWADHRAAAIYGPKLLAANLQSAYVVMNGHLYRLNRLGVIQDAVTLGTIGFSRTPCDMQALADGRLLIGNREARTIYTCDANLYECRPFYTLPAVDASRHLERAAEPNAFDFYFDAATERLFIVDAMQDEFTIVALASGQRSLVLDKEDLTLPADIWVDHSGTARIADSARQGIAGVMTESSQFKAFFSDYPGRSEVARQGHYFPIALVQGPQNNWWVLNANPMLMKADLILYNQDGIAQKRIALPEDAQPESLAVFENRLLVADPANFVVYSVNLEDLAVGHFGAQPFVDESGAFKHQASIYQHIAGMALLVMFLFIFLSLLLVWKVYLAARQRSYG